MMATLFVFLTLVFFLINAQPGDVSNFYALNPDLPPETRERLQGLFGLDEPLWKQYLTHVRNALTGNFGVSFSHYPREVADIIRERLPRTLVLFVTASVISFYLGFALGKIIAWRRGGMDGVHRHNRRRRALYRVHPVVRLDDDLAFRVPFRLVSNRQVPRPDGLARRAGGRQRRLSQDDTHGDSAVRRRRRRFSWRSRETASAPRRFCESGRWRSPQSSRSARGRRRAWAISRGIYSST